MTFDNDPTGETSTILTDRTESAGPFVRRLWGLSAAALVVVTILWVGSRCRSSGDTWVALTSGRLICEKGYADFPIEDEFSFTFDGKTWTNQNWLTHVVYWWVYDRWCPSGLVALKLLLAALLGLTIWKSIRLLSNDRPVALLAACAGLLAIGEFIDIRPNLTGFVCLAMLFGILLSLKHGRGWVVALIPLLMTLWGSAHGSFLLGFGLLGIFLLSEAGQRFWRRPVVLTSRRRLFRLLLVTMFSVILVAVTSPYHLSNFTHPLVVMAGRDKNVFQEVLEWHPPHKLMFLRAQVTGYWVLMVVSIVIWIAAVVRGRRRLPDADDAVPVTRIPAFDATELLFSGVGWYLSLKHLRFIPLFVILSLPITVKILTTSLHRGRRAAPGTRRSLIGITIINWALVAYFGGIRADDLTGAYVADTDEPYRTWLFNKHVRHDRDPYEPVDFAKRCGLSGHIYNEWSWGGYLMFHAPEFQLFIDGRAQALYSAEHCEQYFRLKNDPENDDRPAALRGRGIDRRLVNLGVSLVLAKRTQEWASNIIVPLLETGLWHPLFESKDGILLVNGVSDDPAIAALMHKYWAEDLDWPDTSYGWRIRGHIRQNGPDPNHREAIDAFRRAIESAPEPWLYERLLSSWRNTGELRNALKYYRSERERLDTLADKSPEKKELAERCLQSIDRIISKLQALRRPQGDAS